MDDAELRELQDPANWDMDRAEVRHPDRPARAVVSVAFQRDDFDFVADAAGKAGMKTSAYIRAAVLVHAKRRSRRTHITLTNTTASLCGPVRIQITEAS